MQCIAYITNQFPSPFEPYVAEEIKALRSRGIPVVPCSVRLPASKLARELHSLADETLYLQLWKFSSLCRACFLGLRKFPALADLIWRIAVRGQEPAERRARALLHTLLGIYFASLLREKNITHIHVHHGYFAAWIAMVASRILRIPFSMTIHGSDLLVHGSYLDTKLQNCEHCYTVSQFNRKYILEHYPQIDPDKVLTRRLGVRATTSTGWNSPHRPSNVLRLLSVGRLHPVKNHAFLLAACRELKARRVALDCVIAGEGPERSTLERLIREFELSHEVHLVGQLSHSQLIRRYSECDIVVLTSRSEGIPVVLMEAMSHERIVLAPDITGIPELITPGKTGFLYLPGSLDDFVSKIEMIRSSYSHLDHVRRLAREHVAEHFNSETNLEAFVDLFLRHLSEATEHTEHRRNENPLLQQI